MVKKLSDKQKESIVNFFKKGKTIDELSKEFNYTKLTISRNLKKNLGEKLYKELIIKSKLAKKNFESKIKKSDFDNKYDEKIKSRNEKLSNEKIATQEKEEFTSITPFLEITPLDFEIDNTFQKDLASIPIADINFPNIVYMIVNKKTELEIKFLNDYPEWQFLSKEELSRKTIEIFSDLKVAKRSCNKDQKVIKVPNTNVFKLVSSQLIAKGITRIISAEQLIAL